MISILSTPDVQACMHQWCWLESTAARMLAQPCRHLMVISSSLPARAGHPGGGHAAADHHRGLQRGCARLCRGAHRRERPGELLASSHAAMTPTPKLTHNKPTSGAAAVDSRSAPVEHTMMMSPHCAGVHLHHEHVCPAAEERRCHLLRGGSQGALHMPNAIAQKLSHQSQSVAYCEAGVAAPAACGAVQGTPPPKPCSDALLGAAAEDALLQGQQGGDGGAVQVPGDLPGAGGQGQ